MRFGQLDAAAAAPTLARPRATNTERESNHARENPRSCMRVRPHRACIYIGRTPEGTAWASVLRVIRALCTLDVSYGSTVRDRISACRTTKGERAGLPSGTGRDGALDCRPSVGGRVLYVALGKPDGGGGVSQRYCDCAARGDD